MQWRRMARLATCLARRGVFTHDSGRSEQGSYARGEKIVHGVSQSAAIAVRRLPRIAHECRLPALTAFVESAGLMLRSSTLRLLAFLLLSHLSLRAAEETLFPFVLPWDDSSEGITNVSSWLDKPAGAAGPIRVSDDAHFYVGEKRIRFVGINMSFAAGLPEKADGERIARRLAKFGINVVRFHHMDTAEWPNGICKRGSNRSGELDPEALDRLDSFIAQLKANGIYANINLLVGRRFNEADGLPHEIETLDWKDRAVVGFWNAKHLDLQKEFAKALLGRTNAYTNLSYTNDPTVAFVEINNESGLVHSWLGGKVDEYPELFLDDLERQWNDWLKQRYQTVDRLREAWSEGAQPLGDEMLKNGRFGEGLQAWNLERHQGADATTTTAEGALQLRVNRTGPETWHLQLTQGGLSFECGKAYSVSFRAKAKSPQEISVGVVQSHGTYSNLGLSARAELSNEWRDFRYVFNASIAEEKARVSFASFGGPGSEVELTNVSVRPGGVEGLRAGEQLGGVSRFEKVYYGQRTPAAQRDWMRFLVELEDRYWQGMASYLKNDLKVNALVAGTIGGCSPLNVQAKLDWVDTHSYWQHPRFPRKPWDPGDWIVPNQTMVNERGGTLPGLALKRVAGKPHTVTEYNHPAPNTFSSEGFLLLAAYAALQDWDAIYAYSYAHTRNGAKDWDSQRMNSYFDIDQHPTKMATLVGAAAMFLRGDVKAAKQSFVAPLPMDAEVDLLRTAKAWSLVDGGQVGLPRELALVSRVAVSTAATSTSAPASPDVASPSRLDSDSGELSWDVTEPGRGVVTINSESTKGVIGYGGGKRFPLGSITIEPGASMQDGWSTVTVSKMNAAAYLVTVTGVAENTGMGWKNAEKNTVGRDWGTAPSIVEGVPVTVTIDVAGKAKVQAWALDGRGQRTQSVPVSVANGKAILEVGPKWRTLWYEMRIE